MTVESSLPDFDNHTLGGCRLAFVGAGVMAESMIAGMLARDVVDSSRIVASHPRSDRRQALIDRFGIDAVESNADAGVSADLIFITVKPQALIDVLNALAGKLRHDQVVVSIAAGAGIAMLERSLKHAAIVRVMPNTPAQIGEGMLVWTATPAVTSEQRARVQAVLSALGEELYVDEE